MRGQLSWKQGGFALGLVFFIAILLVKPIGVSTQFVIFDGMLWSLFSKELITQDEAAKYQHRSNNAYLNKSGGQYAKNISKPINYGFVFVLSIILGAFISSKTQGPVDTKFNKAVPEIWKKRFGDSHCKRYIFAFLGGILVLFGSRLAGGCTSGHMMSGMMQTAVSGYLFAASAFLAAIPCALLTYKGRE